MAWSQDQVDILKELTPLGFSAAQIAARVGHSRNAVIGKWHRLGLSGNGSRKWDPNRTRRLKRMWVSGYTYPQIAAKLGLSAGAVEAKVGRMRQKKANLAKRPPAKRSRMGIVEAIAGSPATRRVEVPGKFKFLELKSNQCHWPTGEGAAMMFCGDPKLGPFPYCAAHARMAYHPARSRRQGEAVYLGLVVARRAKQVKINGSVVALSPDGAAA